MIIMLTKDELEKKDNFKVNAEEYSRIQCEEDLSLFDYEISDFYESVLIHKKLKNLFESDTFIYKLIMTNAYSDIIKGKNQYGYPGNLSTLSFDHTSTMRLRSDVSEVSVPDTVTGVITFPYFHDWMEVKLWIDKVPDTYSVYIFNPILLFYGCGTVGLFLTPKYFTGHNIESCNRFIISVIGYPLFLTFTMEDTVDEINHIDLGLCKEDFVKEFYSTVDDNKCLLKILNFWKDNSDVRIPFVDESYDKYLDFQPYLTFDSLGFIKIISKRSFKLVHEDTGEILGTFREFSLDEPFKVIDTEKGEFKLSDDQLKDIVGGKYDFKY